MKRGIYLMCHFGDNLRTVRKVIFVFFWAVCFLSLSPLAQAQGLNIKLDYKSRYFLPLTPQKEEGLSVSTYPPLLRNKLRFERKVDVDYDQGYATIHDKMGLYSIYHPLSLDLHSYIHINNQSKYRQGWLNTLESSLKGEQRDKGGGLLNFEIPVKFPKLVTKIIGEGGPGLRVNGSRRISFSGKSSWEEGLRNTATSRQSKFPSLNMEQISRFTITGNVGTRVSVKVDQDSKRQSDLENTMHLKYTGDEDGIVQSIEAGNTTLGMRSGLMGYSQSVKGLFGIKTQAKFGGLDLTMIASQEKGSTQKAEFKAGAETNVINIRDYEYLHRTFFHLGQDIILGHQKDDFEVGDSIIYNSLRLYVSDSRTTNNSDFSHGVAYVDPDNIDSLSEEVEYRRFKEMDYLEYQVFLNKTKTVNPNGTVTYTLPYVELNRSLNEQDVLAVYYEVLHESGRVDTVGNLDYYNPENTDNDTAYVLKLVKHHYPKNDYITWEYEWKNVYYLRNKNIDPEGVEIDIYKGPKGGENTNQDLNNQDGVRYLGLLGLDRYNTSGQRQPDGVFDQSQLFIENGYLFFPQRHPFSSDLSFTGNPEDTLKEKIHQIYTSNVDNDITEASKYYIYVQSATRKSEYPLGHAPIIEGSEVVTLNGRRLTRGTDYDLVYEIGLIRFLTDEALEPDARVSVDYEYAPLFMPERKSLFGFQGKYDFGEKLEFDWVALYKSEKSTDDRPRVGEEPSKNFGWGGTLRYNSPFLFLTNMIDALPLLETETESRINFSFQGGGSIPNPNTKNKAFVDDFESSLDYTDLGIRRGSWTLSSLPDTSYQRTRMYWYNPYDQVRIDEIWPNKEAWRGENRTNVLNIVFLPDRPHAPVDTLKGKPVCSGIMRPISQGNYDQSRKRFLEVWVRGEVGTLYVDLGQISEDAIPNGRLDTEDKSVYGQSDGILDEHEDTGLDTLMSNIEPGHEKYSDPNGDDFEYKSDDRSLRYDYTRINGTEGNIDDPDRGRRPDTEDINYNGIVDLLDNYFEYTIDLSSKNWIEGTDNNGWRLYRIPLKDSSTIYYSEVGNPDWNTIQFARVWITAPESSLVQIASLQLVGNKWLNSGITMPEEKKMPDKERQGSIIGGGDYLNWLEQQPEESKFEIFVTNTHENVDYYPPPKVAGILDRKTKVREKEQSLVFRFEDLQPYHTGSTYRVLYSTEDYTNYHYMSMWIHGPENTSDILFFFRMGLDSTKYYEYHTEVSPG
ncbi:MAG: cell surface protein SprA, partial [Candidatus Zixiibacteriota bacterium]